MSCSSFGESPPDESPTDAASPDAASPDAASPDVQSTIRCGKTSCPVAADSVCCATTAGSTCTTAAACSDAPLACDDTEDCARLGFPSGIICCAYNNGDNSNLLLERSACVLSTACDATGPRDQMCDPAGSPEQCQVAMDGRTKCAAIRFENARGYAICQ